MDVKSGIARGVYGRSAWSLRGERQAKGSHLCEFGRCGGIGSKGPLVVAVRQRAPVLDAGVLPADRLKEPNEALDHLAPQLHEHRGPEHAEAGLAAKAARLEGREEAVDVLRVVAADLDEPGHPLALRAPTSRTLLASRVT
jgi:hypothetical protein